LASERKKGPEGPDAQIIRELARLLDETNLSEIEIEREGLRLRVARNMHVQAGISAPLPVLAHTAEAPVAPAPATGSDLAKHPGAVKSPMVGTVYTAPEPGAAKFTNLGDTVAQGQTLLLVEAMKTMNPIVAHRAGKVAQILVENEAPVEYGQVLMVIE
jgi:acetyl-CoA carboxylase biotin carboxyl carrier protein